VFAVSGRGIIRLYATGVEEQAASGAGVPVYGRTRVSTGRGADLATINNSLTKTATGDSADDATINASRTRVLVGSGETNA